MSHYRRSSVCTGGILQILLAFTVTLVFCGSVSAAGDEKRNQGVPPELVESLKTLLSSKIAAPNDVTLTRTDHSIQLSFRCRNYAVHSDSKRSFVWETGPAEDGFCLTLECVSHSGQDSSFAGWGRPQPQAYWIDYSNFYRLHDLDSYLQLRWSYGPLTDVSLLDVVRDEVVKYSTEKYSHRFADPALESWKENADWLKKNVSEVMKEFCPGAKWRLTDDVLVCEFNTTQFDVHSVDHFGIVNAEAHHESGPRRNGFLLRFSHSKLSPTKQRLLRYERTKQAYWEQYSAVYGPIEPIFRIDVLYGEKTDRVLLQAVLKKIATRFTPPEPF